MFPNKFFVKESKIEATLSVSLHTANSSTQNNLGDIGVDSSYSLSADIENLFDLFVPDVAYHAGSGPAL